MDVLKKVRVRVDPFYLSIFLSFFLSLSRTHTLSLTNTHSLTHTNTHTLSLTLSSAKRLHWCYVSTKLELCSY